MAATPLQPGRLLGQRYRIVRLLGEGGMGAVYEAIQEDLGRRVALKVLHNAEDSAAIERFQREARSAAALGHPNIVQVTDFQWPEGEPPFLVMEFFDGHSLGELLKRESRLPGPRMAFIASQMLDALAAAHRAGIVHRDIKPDNVQLVSIAGMSDIVKLVDFGVAKLEGQGGAPLTALGAAIGSPAFMAPEQVQGTGVGPHTDLYAVGVTMYRAIAGRPMFDATTLPDLYQSILTKEPPPLALVAPDCDPALAAIVTRALSKDPRGRFLNAEAFKSALEPFHKAAAAPTFAATPSIAPYAAVPYPSNAPAAFSAAPAGPPVAPPGGFGAPSAFHGTMGGGPPVQPKSGLGIGCVVAGVAVAAAGLVVAGAATFFLMRGASSSAVAVTTTPMDAGPAALATADPASTSSVTTPASTAAATKPGGALVVVTGKDAGATKPSTTADVDAGAPPGLKRYGARTASLSGGTWTNEWELDHSRGKVSAIMPSISGCFGPTEYTPPDHQFVTLNLSVSAAGKVTNVGAPPGATAPRCLPLEQCMAAYLRTVDFGPTKSKKPTEVQVSFRAELPFAP